MAARQLAFRQNLRVGIAGKSVIDAVKGKYNFFSDGKSVCVLKRYDGKTIKLDLSSQQVDFMSWISHTSLKPVEILDRETVDVQQSIGTSMLMLFVDTISDPSNVGVSKAAIGVLENLAPKY